MFSIVFRSLVLIAWKEQGSLEGRSILKGFKYGENSYKYNKENTIFQTVVQCQHKDIIRRKQQ